MLTAILALMAALGLLLLFLGLRGRRLDSHPVCRRCRLDLFGIYPASATCPHCGTNLTRPSAIRAGRRRTRYGPLITGAALLAATLAIVGLTIGTRATNFNWNTIKPTRLLLLEARRTGSFGAGSELAQRYADGALSIAQVRQLADLVLDIHEDDNAAWGPLWEGLLFAISGDLTDEELVRYSLQTMRIGFEIGVSTASGPRVRQNAQTGFRPLTFFRRPVAFMPVHVSITVDWPHIDHEPADSPLPAGRSFQYEDSRRLGPEPLRYRTVPIKVTLPPGRHTFTASARASLARDDKGGRRVIAEWDRREQITLDVVPHDVDVLQRVSGSEVDDAIRRAMTASDIQLIHERTRLLDLQPDSGRASLGGSVHLRSLPVPMAARLRLESADGRVIASGYLERHWRDPLHDLNAPASFPIYLPLPSDTFQAPYNTPLDLVFTSDTEWAEIEGMPAAWDGRVVVTSGLVLAPPPPDDRALIAELLADVRSNQHDRADKALKALIDRIAEDRLPADATAELVELALSLQANRAVDWNAAWGTLVETARQRGRVADAQYARYLHQPSTVRWYMEPTVRRGTLLHVGHQHRGGRLGAGSGLATICTLDSITISDFTYLPDDLALPCTISNKYGGHVMQIVHLPFQIPPGEHAGSVRWTCRIIKAGKARDLEFEHHADGPTLATWTDETTSRIVVPLPSSEAIRLVADESLRPAMAAALTVSNCRLDSDNQLMCELRVATPPFPIAFQAFARSGDREWPLSAVVYRAGQSHQNWLLGSLDGFNADTVTILLRPSAEAIDKEPGYWGITEIWDGKLEFPDLPLQQR